MTAEHLVRQPVDLASSRRASPLAAALDASLTEVAAEPFSSALRWWVASKGEGIDLHVTWAPHVPAPVLRATRVAAGIALLAVRLAVAGRRAGRTGGAWRASVQRRDRCGDRL